MVDPTKGIGSVQNLISGSRVSESTSKKINDVKDTSTPKDEVTLSTKALSLSEAKEAASNVRAYVESDKSVSLSTGGNFDESL